MPLLIIIYSVMGLLICKYEPFWQDVRVEFLIPMWLLRPVGFLCFFYTYANANLFITGLIFLCGHSLYFSCPFFLL